MKISKIRVWQTNPNLPPRKWIIDIYDEYGYEFQKIISESEPKVEKEK